LLLERGANPNAAPSRDRHLPQTSLHRYALLEGRDRIADLLIRHGARRDDITGDDQDAFVAALVGLDRDRAAAIAERHPDYLRTSHFLCAAAERNRADVVALLLDLGVPVNIQGAHRRTALHAAAASDARDTAKVLLERGADANIHETQYGGTPLGFASHYAHQGMIDLLTPYSRDVWTLAHNGKIDRLREVMAAEPARAREMGSNGRTALWWLPNDEDLAMQVVELLLAHGADPSVKAHDGTTAADAARAIGLERVARRLEKSAD
jgi:ankyrin repeat protein